MKHTILIIQFLIFTITLSSQTQNHGGFDYHLMKIDSNGQLQWSKFYGGTLNDEARQVIKLRDNNFVLAGYSDSDNGDVKSNIDWEDYWLLKVNDKGDIIWSKTFGGSQRDKTWAIFEDSNGDLIVPGYTWSHREITGYHGGGDWWILKLNQDGDTIWTKAFGSKARDYPSSGTQLSDNSYLINGFTKFTNENITEEPQLENYKYPNHADGWILKLDQDGEVVFSKTYGGSWVDYFSNTLELTDGGFLIAGETSSPEFICGGKPGELDLWLLRLDSNGDTLWTKSFGGRSHEKCAGIVSLNDSKFLLIGLTWSKMDDFSDRKGNGDFWIQKLDIEGNILWSKTYGGTDEDRPRAFLQTESGNVIIVGRTSSNDGDVNRKTEDVDYWIMEISSTGEIIWSNVYGGSDWDEPFSICPTDDNGYLILGQSMSKDFKQR